MWLVVVVFGFVCYFVCSDMMLFDFIFWVKLVVVLVGSYGLMDVLCFGFCGIGFVVGDGWQIVINVYVLLLQEVGCIDWSVVIQVWILDSGWLLCGVCVVEVDLVYDLVVLWVDDGELLLILLLVQKEVFEGEVIVLIGFFIGGVLGYLYVMYYGIVLVFIEIVLFVLSLQGLNEKVVCWLCQGNFKVFQFDVIVYFGNSGGLVIDVVSGEVVGVINMVFIKVIYELVLS